jgi:hypothetical protein
VPRHNRLKILKFIKWRVSIVTSHLPDGGA